MTNTYGYVRVSSADQNEDRQLDAMTALGVSPERVFVDKLSGKDKKRPQLLALMETVQRGDKVIVESISRFARNTRDLLELAEQLSAKGVEFVSLKEALDTTTPTGKFILTIFGAVSELERGYILQRQA
ncbi:MAG: recombinase family protein [Clostridium sp.]|nr:recombinase family protein [Clostridium sp.]